MNLAGLGRLRAFWAEGRGAAAVEMALVLPAALFLMLGGANLILLTYAVVCLHSAAEASARYASMQTADNSGTHPSSSTVTTAATSFYKGPGVSASFTYTSASGTCGSSDNLVTASGTYRLYYGIARLSVPLSTQSCFP
jgi:Flp pilus assembly protein TadG